MSINTTSAITASAKEQQVFMDKFSTCAQLLCVLFGIPANLVIILLIIFRRHLRHQPRNTIWIGIGVSNILFLFANLLELIGFYSTEASDLCRIRFFLIGFPVASLMMNHILSLADRYLSIFHSAWYRRCVTVRWVFGIQLTAFILLFFLMKPHYIFRLIPVNCTFVPSLDKATYFGFIFFFLILCLTGQLTLYFMIKKHLMLPCTNAHQHTYRCYDTTANGIRATAPTRKIQKQKDSNRAIPNSIDGDIFIAPEEAVRLLSQPVKTSYAMKKNQHFVRIRNQMVSRLELAATRNVILSVGIMLLFTLPWIISSILSLICNASVIHQAVMDSKEKSDKALVEQCSRYYWADSYTRFIYLIGHCIYQFFCYVSRRKDFCTAPLGQSHGRRRYGCSGTREPARKTIYPRRMREMSKRISLR